MRIKMGCDQKAGLIRGKSYPAGVEFEVTDEQLVALTVEEREFLRDSLCSDKSCYEYRVRAHRFSATTSVDGTTWEDLVVDLRHRLAQQIVDAEKQAEKERVEREQRLVVEAAAMRDIEKAKAEQEAKTQAKEQFIRGVISDHGSESQKARHAEGLLPATEITELLGNRYFDLISGDLTTYTRMTRDDVPHSSSDYEYGHHVKFTTSEATELTEEQFATLCGIRSRAKLVSDTAASVGSRVTVQVTPRSHVGYCEDDGCDDIEQRYGILVVIDLGHEIELTREFGI